MPSQLCAMRGPTRLAHFNVAYQHSGDACHACCKGQVERVRRISSEHWLHRRQSQVWQQSVRGIVEIQRREASLQQFILSVGTETRESTLRER